MWYSTSSKAFQNAVSEISLHRSIYVWKKKLFSVDTLSRVHLSHTEKSDTDLQLQTQAFVDTVISGLPVSHSRLDQVKYHYHSGSKYSSILAYCRKAGLKNRH